MADAQGGKEDAERFFSVKQSDDNEKAESASNSAASNESEVDAANACLTLRVLQFLLPCLRKRGVWEPSQGDVFQSQDAEETKYPRILQLLENKIFDVIFVCSCFISIYLFLFSEGFLIESRLLWGIIHLVNAVYALGLFSQWLQILIKSKYAKTNHGYTNWDIAYTLLSVFPADLIVLAIYTLNDKDDNDEGNNTNPIELWMITVSRLNYFLRIRSILQYFNKWEDQLVVGDFRMFMIRICFFTTFILHMFACLWHRIACDSFMLKHFKMQPDEATVELCDTDSSKPTWIALLSRNKDVPLLDHPDWHVLITHYVVSLYWTILAMFRLGASDIKTSLVSELEVAFVSVTEITAWIYVLTFVNGTLASLLIEKESERENFIVRCFAIRQFLHFGRVSRTIQDDIMRFYNYLWEKSSGILNLDLVDAMPHAMKSEVFYDVNKFVLDQLPILKGLETPFLMGLSVRTTHRFYMSGEYLFRRNEIANAMYYLVKGHLEVLSEDEKHAITSIRSGSVIGELSLLQPYPHVASVRCGTDSEIRMLSRKHFKQVLNIYPQYEQVLEQRMDMRLEQCGLLLALCEKHNTYHKAFKAVKEFYAEHDFGFPDSELGHSFENVTKILTGDMYENIQSPRQSDDFDGLSLEADVEGQLLYNREMEKRFSDEKKSYEELLATAFEAVETDVARAVSLANDLNIPRSPLFVSAPETSVRVTLFKKQQSDAESVFVVIFRKLKEPDKGHLHALWKFIVSCCALGVFWYYPYQFAFRKISNVHLDYVAHFCDVIFALDFLYDMIQVVITPQKSFESAKEIAIYRFRSFYFYLRFLAFLPFEYVFSPLVGSGESLSPYFYLFKMNRLIEIHIVVIFLSDFETKYHVKPILMCLVKFGLGLLFVNHLFAVFYAFLLRDIQDEELVYREAFYWAVTTCTSLGYGDLPSQTNSEIIAEIFGVIVGVAAILHFQGKMTAMLVNCERKRISFKQTYYSLKNFMKRKRFSKFLWNRICRYYKLQWLAHEGTLIPGARSVIWDAPKSLVSKVAYSHANRHVHRIPLFMDSPLYLQNEICVALKHYVIPPGEILLYPEDLVRDLYIISKGHVEVIYKGKRIGVFTEGRFFGLNCILYGINTPFMFRAITHCQVFCLTFDSFWRIASTNTNFVREYEILSGRAKFTPRQEFIGNVTQELPDYPPKTFLPALYEKGQPTMEFPPDIDEIVEDGSFNLEQLRAAPLKLSARLKAQFQTTYILPNGSGIRCWMAIRILFAFLVTIFAPAQAAFPMNPETSLTVTIIFDVVAWLDIAISTRIAFYGSENQLVTSTGQMIRHYLKGAFIVDILGCFPADMILYAVLKQYPDYDHKYYLVPLLRLNRMLQGYEIIVVNGLMEKAMSRRLSFVMLLEMVPVMFIFMNLTTCLAVLAVCGFSFDGKAAKCTQDAWIINGIERLDYTYSSSETQEKTSILTDASRAYIIALYWVTQSVFCVGYGDIEIGDLMINQVVCIFVVFIGILVTSYCSSKLTSCIVGEDPAKIELQEKMRLMNNYLENQRAAGSVRRRVRETYLNAWDKTRGVSSAALFLALPPTLKTDVMKQLYGATLRSSPLFQDLDGPGLRMLASSLTEIFFPEGEFLMKFGDLCNDIYFIAHGAVVCYNVRGTIMSQMGHGSLIAEIAPFFHTHRLYTTIAVKDVNAYVFKKEVFMIFLDQYPEIKKTLEKVSNNHYKEAMKGTKRPDNLDFDIMTSFHSEKPLGDAGADTVAVLKGLEGDDPTRNLLSEDLMKSPDDFSKSGNEKWWSYFVTFGRMARDDMGLIHIYQELGQCNILNFTVHPASPGCNWVSFSLILTAVSCSITAYEMAFAGVEDSDETDGLIAFRDVLEIFFIIRIIGNFHLGYYDETATLITDVKKIAKRYMAKVDGFWLDALTTLPFYLLELAYKGVITEYIRSIQLLRVGLFVRYLNETESGLNMKASRVKILKITILLCFIFHFWACTWYLVACYDEYCTLGSWMDKTLNDLFVYGGMDPNNISVGLRYLLSLYYVTNSLTFTGFADILARTNVELCLTITMIFATVFVIGYLVGEMAQCMASQVSTKIHYQHKLAVLENHFNILGISQAKIVQVRNHFRLLWFKCRGTNLFNLMEELPFSLRADVAMEIYGINIRSSRILGKLDDNLIRQISARIHQEIYFPGSYIVRAGDICNSLYFIKSGEVVILDGSSNLELCVEILYENECFGEVKILLPQEQYRFSYVARLETEVGVLHVDDLEAVLRNHPRVYEDLREKANKIKVRRQSLREDEAAAAAAGLSVGETSKRVSGSSRAVSAHSVKVGVKKSA